jgi:hypothetical protein
MDPRLTDSELRLYGKICDTVDTGNLLNASLPDDCPQSIWQTCERLLSDHKHRENSFGLGSRCLGIIPFCKVTVTLQFGYLTLIISA